MNFKMKFLSLLLATLLGAIGVFAQKTEEKVAEPKVFTFGLTECLVYASQHQVDVLNARIDQKSAEYKVRETAGIGLPQVSGSFDYNHYITIPTTAIPNQKGGFVYIEGGPKMIGFQMGAPNSATAGLKVTQLLFDGSFLVGLKASKEYRELTKKALHRTEIETKVAVSKAYYSVLVSKERMKLLDANIERLEKYLFEVEQMHKNGFVERLDLDRVTVQYNNLKTERENVVRLLDLNLNLLKFQMGMPIEANLVVEGVISENVTDIVELGSETDVYRKRVEYQLLEQQKNLYKLDELRYKAAYLPSLAAFGSFSKMMYGLNVSDLKDYIYPANIVGLSLSIPIFSSGQRYYKVKQAKMSVQKAENDIINFRNAVNLQVLSEKTNYMNSLTALRTQKKNRELASDVLTVTKKKYQQGVGSNLEVTTAETSLKEAENNYIDALYEVIINKINYEKVTGKLN